MRRVCVFLGSNMGNSAYVRQAQGLARELAARSLEVVYGGANVGLMKVLADTALENGGQVVGVLPEALLEKELAHPGLTELIVTASMHERKARMVEISDAFIALPGGLGTMEELCEVLTWAQLGFHGKPCGLLDATGYYAGLALFLDTAVQEGFVTPEHRAMLMSDADPAALLDKFVSYTPPTVEKWIQRPNGL